MNSKIKNNFHGKTVVISGSSKGIGKVLAQLLGDGGANVVINGTQLEPLEKTNHEFEERKINVFPVQGNVVKYEDCEALAAAAIKQFGSIDILIANAGISAEGTLEESSPEVFRQAMDVNYFGVVQLIKSCLPALKKSRGSILITGSAAGLRGMPSYGAYSASKMALTALVDALQIELIPSGIHIGLAYVGMTENDLGKTTLDAHGKTIQKRKIAAGKVAPQQKVACQIINMIEKRQFKKIFSTLGKLNAFLVRFAPGLGHWIIKNHYLKKVS